MMDKKPSVFCYVTPFASPASVKHAEKLIYCLAQTAGKVSFAGDERIRLIDTSTPIKRLTLPTLHYLSTIHPKLISIMLWIVHLFRGILISCWFLFRNRRDIDIVICFLGLYYTPILLCARLLGVCAISFEPTNDMIVMQNAYGNKWWWRLLKHLSLFLRGVNRTVANFIVIESLFVMEQGNLHRFQQKVHQANLYVDTNTFSPTVPLCDREPIMGFLGRLSAGKGIELILDAAKSLSGKGYRFEIVGDGPLREFVEKVVELPGMSHVKYLGWQEYEAIPGFLNRIRLLLLPSVGEGMPNVAIEAMACSTPVLASPVGGIPELISHKETGFIISERTAHGLSEAIIDALTDTHLPQIGENARKHVMKNYSVIAATEKWRNLFNGLHNRTEK